MSSLTSATMFESTVYGAIPPQPSRLFFGQRRSIARFARDAVGAAISGATIEAFRTADDVKVVTTLSQADGWFDVSVYDDQQYWLRGTTGGGLASTSEDAIIGVQV
jgi:hypothetical protein